MSRSLASSRNRAIPDSLSDARLTVRPTISPSDRISIHAVGEIDTLHLNDKGFVPRTSWRLLRIHEDEKGLEALDILEAVRRRQGCTHIAGLQRRRSTRPGSRAPGIVGIGALLGHELTAELLISVACGLKPESTLMRALADSSAHDADLMRGAFAFEPRDG